MGGEEGSVKPFERKEVGKSVGNLDVLGPVSTVISGQK